MKLQKVLGGSRLKHLKGLLLGSIITLIISFTLYYSMQHMNEDSYNQLPVSSRVHMKQVTLNNDNIVDVISSSVNTAHLSKISLNRQVLEVVLLVDKEQTAEQLIYTEIPEFVTLAFEHTLNIEQLKVKVMENQLNRNDSVIILTCNLYRNDAWLENGSRQLKDVQWLIDSDWLQKLRIKKTIYWQK